MESRKKKRNEDRISDLPDAIIQHILSFLPSTKQAIHTSVLSKRWRNQWTRVPVLIFNSDDKFRKNFLKFIDNTLLLHDSSKLHKFHLGYPSFILKDPQFAERIAFATRKYVEELNLFSTYELLLPEFLFNNDSLVKLSIYNCKIMPSGKVNWGCLSSLEIAYCNNLHYQAIENIVCGSPSLKSLELKGCALEKIVIASKSLKKLLIESSRQPNISVLEISCPNLEELSLQEMHTKDPQLFPRVIENVLSFFLLLESFELIVCYLLHDRLIIASKSLKKLVLEDVGSISSHIEISCPQLEELKLIGDFDVNTAKLLNLSSLLRATINIYNPMEQTTCESLIIEILQQLQHLKELKIGNSFLKNLSTIKVGGQTFLPVLNILTLNTPRHVKHYSGIAHLLHMSPMLEKLVINVQPYTADHTNIGENYWDSNAVVFYCLVSHLKTIKITGFPEVGGRHEHMLNFVKFLLKNARVLEKMVVILEDLDGTSQSDLDSSRILLSLPRCSQNAVIEVSHIWKNYWDSNAVVFDCLVSHLKTIRSRDFQKKVADVGIF